MEFRRPNSQEVLKIWFRAWLRLQYSMKTRLIRWPWVMAWWRKEPCYLICRLHDPMSCIRRYSSTCAISISGNDRYKNIFCFVFREKKQYVKGQHRGDIWMLVYYFTYRTTLDLYSLSGWTSYRKISRSLGIRRFLLLWNFTALPKRLSNFRKIRSW